ncbi:Outer membrane lipoprotein-sorting protein [Parelusimicrobium proximum]|uniref:LolA family protein n=1 Tax=Parelusimicrobium proximum TaxID=3228953 RepID=UPI003D16BAC1
MKKIICLFLFSFIACAAYSAEADYSYFAEVNTIESGFTMEKHLSIASKPLISKGKFYFERPGFLRWEYASPFPSGILLSGSKAWSWKGAGDKKDVKDVSSQPFAKIMAQQIYMFVSMDVEAIGAGYRVEESAKGITLSPKDNSPKQTIDKIALHFNAARNAVTKVEMIEKAGDKTVITFTDTKLNAPIPEEVKKP